MHKLVLVSIVERECSCLEFHLYLLKMKKHIFLFKKAQFPIRLSFAMTINKAQGQTIYYVGIYLAEPVFSRAKTSYSIKILVKPTLNDNSNYDCTKNIVYRELLMLMHC